ncbi:putative ethylene-responsive transcription factor ERF121 [Raphanus sativus]|uniref:Ethylene-responsive transcription factor ERF121 n=1 Tax=Raphanus sativus TaxID=3726 RepID=A0A9W3CLL4_RAPSA|nr:putative ethylene-responsive transcription factor ERF121 [Raphanus sativus]KAJ4872732.1 putative ethylene-responsive transcription factor ERF121 [Raphanus sativus]
MDHKPPRLTRDQEHVIMVSALRQVISNNRGDTSSSNWVAFEALHRPLDAGPCPLCSTTGCYGCAFPEHEEIKKEKKHKGVRKKPSGKWSAEIWDPSLQRRRWLGTFPTAKMAAEAYDDEATKLVKRKAARSDTMNGEEPTIHREDDG